MTVADAMTRELITVRENDSALASLKALVSGGVGGAPVVSDDGRLLGIVSEYDLLLALDFVGEQVPVSRIMTSEVVSVGPETTLKEARDMFVKHAWRSVPVVDGARIVGVLSRRDILRAEFGL